MYSPSVKATAEPDKVALDCCAALGIPGQLSCHSRQNDGWLLPLFAMQGREIIGEKARTKQQAVAGAPAHRQSPAATAVRADTCRLIGRCETSDLLHWDAFGYLSS